MDFFFLGDNPVTILEYGRSNITTNINTVTTLFGSENCNQENDFYICSNYDYNLLVNVYNDGSLRVADGMGLFAGWECSVYGSYGECQNLQSTID